MIKPDGVLSFRIWKFGKENVGLVARFTGYRHSSVSVDRNAISSVSFTGSCTVLHFLVCVVLREVQNVTAQKLP
jgi:hypothetical protein